MNNKWIRTACVFLLCACLSSCHFETTTGKGDGIGLAFPKPGTAGETNTQTVDDTPVNDVNADDVIVNDAPVNDADASDDIKADEKDEENGDSDTVTTQMPFEASDEEKNEAEKEDESERDDEAHSEDWMLILVNPWNYLPEDYEVKLVDLKNNQKADERVYPELQQMMNDMRAEDLSPYICSSYRTLAKQTNLYNKQIKQYTDKGYSEADAKAEAGRWVAVPGTSEHHTGLAFDIVASYHIVLDESQEKTKEQQWLIKNSWKYGFILRYPNGKTDITGIYYEPWHYRYVGKKAAKEIYESGLTLEEYLRNIR